MMCVMGIVAFVAFKLLSENEKRLSPKVSSNYKSKDLVLEVDYSSPYKKGRVIFGELVKYGEYWRTGADESTEITFNSDVTFGNADVKAGRYRLYTIPDSNKWMVVLNSELGQWGKFEPRRELDVVKVEVESQKLENIEEQLIIDFESTEEGVDLVIKWDNTGLKVPIR